jgi:hypothetical protein
MDRAAPANPKTAAQTVLPGSGEGKKLVDDRPRAPSPRKPNIVRAGKRWEFAS